MLVLRTLPPSNHASGERLDEARRTNSEEWCLFYLYTWTWGLGDRHESLSRFSATSCLLLPMSGVRRFTVRPERGEHEHDNNNN